jgi:hypothetical protein
MRVIKQKFMSSIQAEDIVGWLFVILFVLPILPLILIIFITT